MLLILFIKFQAAFSVFLFATVVFLDIQKNRLKWQSKYSKKLTYYFRSTYISANLFPNAHEYML